MIAVFPNLHASPLVQFETVNNYSLLYTIKGSSSKLTPYLLMAHLDVVPADPSQWEAPPFAAEIKDGFIYARGTIDFKQGVMVKTYKPAHILIVQCSTFITICLGFI